jgi:putative inorganic carbon (HCO3(-)) transporter
MVSLLVAAFAAVAAYYRPWWGVCLLAISIPLDLPVHMGITVYTNELILSGLFLGWLLRTFGERFQAVPWREAVWAAPFFLALGLSGFSSQAWTPVMKQSLRWLEFTGVIGFAAQAVRNEVHLRRVAWTLTAVATGAALWGLVQTAAGPASALNAGRDISMLYAGCLVRAYSLFGHSNQFSGYLVLIIPVTYALLLPARNWKTRLLLGGCLAIQVAALLCTFTRGAWLALLLAAAPLFLIVDFKRSAILLVLALLLASGALALQSKMLNGSKAVMDRMTSLRHPEQEDSVSFRKVCFTTSMRMFREHPWIGFGAGDYDRNIRRFFDSRYYAWEAINKHIHDLYLQILIETGGIGLAAFLLLIGRVLAVMAAGLRRRQSGNEAQILLLAGLLAGTIAFLFHNVTDVVTIYARGIHFSLIAGLGLAVARFLRSDHVADA